MRSHLNGLKCGNRHRQVQPAGFPAGGPKIFWKMMGFRTGVNDGANAHIIAAPSISKITGFYADFLDDAQAFSSC
jgi:hypothetical protein